MSRRIILLLLFVTGIGMCIGKEEVERSPKSYSYSSSENTNTNANTKRELEKQQKQKQLSILFFLVDDGGFEIGTFGNNITHTPHIDNLAKRRGAIVYDRAYTAVSSCSPSRSAILTGLPTHQNGMYGLHQYPGNFQSNDNVYSLPNLLNSAGYQTGIIGKYHVGPLSVYNFSYGLGNFGPSDWIVGLALHHVLPITTLRQGTLVL